MTKQEWIEALLFSGFRLMAACLMLLGSISLIFQLADSWFQFDPNYLSGFFLSTLFRPLVLMVAGILIHILARRLSTGMAASFSRFS